MALLRRKHPDTDLFLDVISGLDKVIKSHQRAYKRVYGVNFNLRGLGG
jgi:hypothetical protein